MCLMVIIDYLFLDINVLTNDACPSLRSTTSDLVPQESENRHQQHPVLHVHCGGLSRIHHQLVPQHRAHRPGPAHLHPGTTQRHLADHCSTEVPLRGLPVLRLPEGPHRSGLFHYSARGYVKRFMEHNKCTFHTNSYCIIKAS